MKHIIWFFCWVFLLLTMACRNVNTPEPEPEPEIAVMPQDTLTIMEHLEDEGVLRALEIRDILRGDLVRQMRPVGAV